MTLFCKEAELGGDDFQYVSVADAVEVEVRRYRTLPKAAGTYLADLLQLYNCVSILGRYVRVSGEQHDVRKLGATPIEKPFNADTDGRLIRQPRFGVC